MNNLEDKKNMALIVLCPHCIAPTVIPKKIEYQIEIIRNYRCWECNKPVTITRELRQFIYATRGDDD